MVNIVRQVTPKGPSGKLKTRWSRRTIVIPGKMGERVLDISEKRDKWLTENGLGGFSKRGAYSGAFARGLEGAGVPTHPAKNLRPSWETWMHWTLRVPNDVIEPLMGHVPPMSRVTAVHYDRPRWEEIAGIVSKCYEARPLCSGQIRDTV